MSNSGDSHRKYPPNATNPFAQSAAPGANPFAQKAPPGANPFAQKAPPGANPFAQKAPPGANPFAQAPAAQPFVPQQTAAPSPFVPQQAPQATPFTPAPMPGAAPTMQAAAAATAFPPAAPAPAMFEGNPASPLGASMDAPQATGDAFGFQAPAEKRDEKYNTVFLTNSMRQSRRVSQVVVLGLIAATAVGVGVWLALAPSNPPPGVTPDATVPAEQTAAANPAPTPSTP